MYVKLGLQILYAVEQFSSLLFKVICVYAVELSSKLFHCTSFLAVCSNKFLFFLRQQHFHSALGFMATQWSLLFRSPHEALRKETCRSLSRVRKAVFDVIGQAYMGEGQRAWTWVKWDVSLNKFSWYDPWRRCYWFVRTSAIFPYYEEDKVKKVKYHSICIKVMSHYSVAAR